MCDHMPVHIPGSCPGVDQFDVEQGVAEAHLRLREAEAAYARARSYPDDDPRFEEAFNASIEARVALDQAIANRVQAEQDAAKAAEAEHDEAQHDQGEISAAAVAAIDQIDRAIQFAPKLCREAMVAAREVLAKVRERSERE